MDNLTSSIYTTILASKCCFVESILCIRPVCRPPSEENKNSLVSKCSMLA